MNAKSTIDKAGRLVLPKPLRDELQLQPGDVLELRTEAGRIVLLPMHAKITLQKEEGVWVYFSGKSGTATAPELIDQDREDRLQRLFRCEEHSSTRSPELDSQ